MASNGYPARPGIDPAVCRILFLSVSATRHGTIQKQRSHRTELEIRVDLLSSDAVRIEAGSRVSFSDRGGEMILTGTVSRIEPAAFTRASALGIEEQRVNLIMQIDDVPKRQ